MILLLIFFLSNVDGVEGLGVSFVQSAIKNDITIPISKVSDFFRLADSAVNKIVPGIKNVSFGHVGDGNIHYNLTQPTNFDKKEFLLLWHEVTDAVNEIVAQLEGSFSAEHGIGQLKRDELMKYRPHIEIELMKTIKRSIDPENIMNPGKIFFSRD